jgi:hypothetical protein
MTSRDRHARLRAQACHIRVRQGQVLQGCARDTPGRAETGDGAYRATNTGRPPTELSERTIDRVRRRRLPASAHNPATTASASDDQQLRPAAPTSTSTIQPPHTSPLTSQFRLERPQ